MSTWNIGDNDVTEHDQHIKDKLSSKDAQIAAHESKLMKQAAEVDELRTLLNDALHKLGAQAAQKLQLEADLSTRTEQLRNEKVHVQNTKATLVATQEQFKEKDLETKELQAIMDSMTRNSTNETEKLKREKLLAEKKVKELEHNLRQAAAAPSSIPAPGRTGIPSRARSSSLSNFKISNLEQDLSDARSQLHKAQNDASTAQQKMAQAQAEVIKLGNEKTALERKFDSEVSELRSRLDDREEELEYLKNAQGDGSREEELLKRIDEDDAKIAALELMMRDSQDTKELESGLRRTEAQLRQQAKQVAEMEAMQVELVAEKEDALDRLEKADNQIRQLTSQLCEKPSEDTAESPDDGTVASLEKLLSAVERLRSERDGLRRDLEFLQLEHKFAIEALRTKETEMSTTSLCSPALGGAHDQPTQDNALENRKRLVTSALAVAVQYTSDETLTTAELLRNAEQSCVEHINALQAANDQIQALQGKLDVGSQCFSQITSERDELSTRLATLEDSSESLKAELREKLELLEDQETLLRETTKSLQDLEAERDSLTLQVTNLTTDLTTAQKELADAETRYSSLQFQQLSSMSDNQASHAWKERIHELEMRVMRRTEQIGIHQHDIKRLETNLRLQEERVSELTGELDVLETEKLAMVDDCADARDQRDEAVLKVERLEVQVEGLERSLEARETELETLVQCIFAGAGRERATRNTAQEAMERYTTQVQTLQAEVDRTNHLLEQRTVDLEAAYRQSTASAGLSSEIEQALAESKESVHALEKIKGQLQGELEVLRGQFESQTNEYTSVQDTNEQLREDLAMARQRVTDLSQSIDLLLATVEEKKEVILQLQDELSDVSQRLEDVEEERDRLRADSDSERLRLDDERKLLLQQAEHKCKEAEALTKATIEEKTTLEARLADVSQKLAESDRSMEDRESELAKVQKALEESAHEAAEMRKSQDGLQALLDQARADLSQTGEQQNKRIAELTAEQQSLEGQLSTLRSQISDKESELQSSVGKVKELEKAAEDAEARHNEEVAALEEDLENNAEQLKEIERLRSDLDKVRSELDGARSLAMFGEDEKTKLQNENANLSAEVQKLLSLKRYNENQLQENDKKIQSLTESLQKVNEDLEESQKTGQQSSASLTLEVVRHQREIAGLRKELVAWQTKPDLGIVVSELEEKNNELEDLLRAKCQEISDNDDRVLEILQEKKKALSKVDSLTRKVQILQTKLAALKSAASEPQPVPASTNSVVEKVSSTNVAPAVPKLQASTTRAPTTALATVTRPSIRSATTPASIPIPDYIPSAKPINPSPNRAVSGPSSLPRPKTPERKSVGASVLRSKTPERGTASSSSAGLPTTAVAGKKRRTPDDYDTGDNQPPQGFTPDSAPARGPEYGNNTSRNNSVSRQRVLSNASHHTGFTPARRRPAPVMNERPIPMMTAPVSPKRPTRPEQPPVATKEVENNNPMLVGEQKPPQRKGWLGRIRGGTVPRQ